MIDTALRFLTTELTEYIVNSSLGGMATVQLKNIAVFDQEPLDVQDHINITLVNIEEESALKNKDARFRNPLTGNIDHAHPPVYLNLYILFSCVPASTGDDAYETALGRLSAVIRFFQHRRSFTLQNSPNAALTNQDLIDFKLIMDLYTLTFEQINHLWGSLGGKQVPFAMYKARLVEVRERKVERVGGVITEIHSSEEIIDPISNGI